MRKTEKAFAVIFLTVVLFFMSTIILRTFTRQILVKRMDMNNGFTEAVLFDVNNLNDAVAPAAGEDEAVHTPGHVEIDWVSLYPFSDGIPRAKLTADSASSDNNMPSFIRAIKKRAEVYTTYFLIWYSEMTELAQEYIKLLHWDYVSLSEYNGVVEMGDGYLATLTAKKDVDQSVAAMISLKGFCDDHGVNFLYVAAPNKVCEIDDKDLSGVLDFSNQNTNELLAALDENNIDYLDLRECLHTEGYKHHELFFFTDHHWKPESGLWASGKIAELLNAEYGYHYDLSLLDQKNFETKVYEEWFLGSQGKKVTLMRASPEDISLLYPKYPTDFHYEIMSESIDENGDFSVFYDMNAINEKDYYTKGPYSAYTYGDHSLEQITNNSIRDDSSLLIVHNSFANCVVPFLALGIKHLSSVDLRHFDGSLERFIQDEKPDTVIVMYDTGKVQGPEYDFR